MVASPNDKMCPNSNTNGENHQAPRKAFKVPPTRRDNRKIFVGGLPSNGMISYESLSCCTEYACAHGSLFVSLTQSRMKSFTSSFRSLVPWWIRLSCLIEKRVVREALALSPLKTRYVMYV